MLSHVNSFALMESLCTFKVGFRSWIISISLIRQSNLLRHFFRTEKLLISFGLEIPCVFLCAFQLTNSENCVRQQVDVSVGWYNRHSPYHIDHIWNSTQRIVRSNLSLRRSPIFRLVKTGCKRTPILLARDWSCFLVLSANLWSFNGMVIILGSYLEPFFVRHTGPAVDGLVVNKCLNRWVNQSSWIAKLCKRGLKKLALVGESFPSRR